MKNYTKIFMLLFFVLLSQFSHASNNTAKFTIKVIGDDGKPVENAIVMVGFERNYQPKDSIGKKTETDSDGKATFTESTSGYITYGAIKDGYYNSHSTYVFTTPGIYGWEPWNQELTILLRKIENPVTMYARNTNESILEIPVIGKYVGFDLIASDWVIPYGKGTVQDFLFKLERRVIDRKNFDATLTVSFSNKFDGIQLYKEMRQYGSLFHLPRYAPESGYEKLLILREWRNPGDGTVKRNINFLDDDVNYLFRVRSEERGGQFIKSMYGKIAGPMDFSAVHSETAKIYFKYYLNPDYTRNLEFDPKRNLFGNLPDLERVKEP